MNVIPVFGLHCAAARNESRSCQTAGLLSGGLKCNADRTRKVRLFVSLLLTMMMYKYFVN